MSLNSKKCFVMSFTRRFNTLHYDYSIDDTKLLRKDTFLDLGVLFDTKCSFNAHIDYILNKAYSKLGCIIRWGREFNDEDILLMLYCSLVRSHLEYNGSLWCPRYPIHIDRIESIQKQFLLRFRYQHLDFNEIPPYKSIKIS